MKSWSRVNARRGLTPLAEEPFELLFVCVKLIKLFCLMEGAMFAPGRSTSPCLPLAFNVIFSSSPFAGSSVKGMVVSMAPTSDVLIVDYLHYLSGRQLGMMKCGTLKQRGMRDKNYVLSEGRLIESSS